MTETERKKLVNDFFARGIADIIPNKEKFKELLLSDKKIRIYIGADPTASKLHLGHSTNILLLRMLQLLGHKIIILIGDFTGMIGDPTDKSATRVQLTRKEVIENAKTYKKQLSKLIDFGGRNPAEIKFNSKWLAKLNAEDLIKLMANFTVQQMIERDMFQKRLSEQKPIGLHEFMYPLMQGYDSVVLKVDAEMGGTDQTFNMLMGRHLVKNLLDKEKFVITTELLVNPKTGKKLMSKSEGNYVGLDDEPNDMYRKIMALPDEVIGPCFRMCTNLDLEEINFSDQPMSLKKKLAWEITRMYHSEKAATEAEEHFKQTVVKKIAPISTPTINVSYTSLPTVNLPREMVALGTASNNSEARRLVEQGGVYLNDRRVTFDQDKIELNKGENILRVGKGKYVKLVGQE